MFSNLKPFFNYIYKTFIFYLIFGIFWKFYAYNYDTYYKRKDKPMYTHAEKNSVRYAAALYRSRQKRRSTGIRLGIFFSILIPSFSALLIFLVSRPI